MWIIPENTYKGKTSWKVKKTYVDKVNNWKAEPARELKWDEKIIAQKFYKVEYLNQRYDFATYDKDIKIPSDKIGEKIGNVTATEYDDFTEKHYNTDASIYKMNNFKEEFAIAVQFNESSDYYAYVNKQYKPETLEDLVNDLNLKEILSFGTVEYTYKFTNWKRKQELQDVEFYGVDNDKIWEILFGDINLKDIYNDNDEPGGYDNDLIGIEVGIPLLGIENKNIIISDRGYLTTNLIDKNGKGFYIGKERARYFMNYIIDNYDGYKIVKVYK